MAARGDTGGTVTAQTLVPILVVDDNAAKRLALRSVLMPLGYHIVEADSGVAALRCVTDQDFAVILLDVRMPIMDGFETANLIRQRKQSENTPIVFITAYGADEISTDHDGGGAVDFMFAPVPPDALRAKVSGFAGLFLKAEDLAARVQSANESADDFRLLVEIVPVGIFRTDGQDRLVYTNPRWSELTGIAAGDAVGGDWHTMIGPEPHLAVETRPVVDAEGTTTGWVGTLTEVTADVPAPTADLLPS